MCAGCAGINTVLEKLVEQGNTPIVRGADGGQARLTIIVCPRTQQGIEATRDLINQMIQYQSELVIARSGGSASLTLNACPAPEVQTVPAPAPSPRR